MSLKKSVRIIEPVLPLLSANIYESRLYSPASRIISSYPLCNSVSKTPNKMFMSRRNQQNDISNQRSISKIDKQYSLSPSKQYFRPKSLQFKNDLFRKIASKMQKQRQVKTIRNQVLNEYYGSKGQKQNLNDVNNLKKNKMAQNIDNKGQNTNSKKATLKESRYQKSLDKAIHEKNPIKFNKIKMNKPACKSNEQIDLVRTSEADIKTLKNSLDMVPIY